MTELTTVIKHDINIINNI